MQSKCVSFASISEVRFYTIPYTRTVNNANAVDQAEKSDMVRQKQTRKSVSLTVETRELPLGITILVDYIYYKNCEDTVAELIKQLVQSGEDYGDFVNRLDIDMSLNYILPYCDDVREAGDDRDEDEAGVVRVENEAGVVRDEDEEDDWDDDSETNHDDDCGSDDSSDDE